MATLILISASLGLQVVAGVISLLLSHIRVYFTRYNDDITEDTCQNLGWCPATICCVTTRPKTARSPKKNGAKNEAFDEMSSALDDSVMADEALPVPLHEDGEEEGDTGCCPCTLTTRIFYDYEYAILDAYDDWTTEYVGKCCYGPIEPTVMLVHLDLNLIMLYCQSYFIPPKVTFMHNKVLKALVGLWMSHNYVLGVTSPMTHTRSLNV